MSKPKGRYVYGDATTAERKLLEVRDALVSPYKIEGAFLEQVAGVVDNLRRVLGEIDTALDKALYPEED